MNHLNTHTNHPIIQREQNYVLDQVVLCAGKIEMSKNGQIQTNISKIQSMRLIKCFGPQQFVYNYKNSIIN